MNHQEEFETIEWGNPKHVLSEFSKNLVCNGAFKDVTSSFLSKTTRNNPRVYDGLLKIEF